MISININNVIVSNRIEEQEEDKKKILEEFIYKVENSRINKTFPVWITKRGEIEWDEILGNKLGLKYIILVAKINNKFLRLKCSISLNARDIVSSIYIYSYSIFSKFPLNGVNVGIYNTYTNDIESFKDSIELIGYDKQFILRVSDSTDIVRAIKIYKEIDDFIQKKESVFLPINLFKEYVVREIDRKAINNNVELIKGNTGSYISEEYISLIPSDSYSKKHIVLEIINPIKLPRSLSSTLKRIIKNKIGVEYSKHAKRDVDSENLSLIDFSIERAQKKDKWILKLFFNDEDIIFDKNYTINIYDKLSYIKSKTMFGIIKDIENRKINNNNLFEYLFNDGSFDHISDINDWHIDENLFRKYSKVLNTKQKQAFEKAVDKFPILFIQGPPGTGKTFTITQICKYYSDIGKNILVSSQTNVAIENILENLMTELSFTNVCVKAEMKNKSKFSIINIISEYEKKLGKILGIDEVKLNSEDVIQILTDASVIGSTTTSSALKNRIWNNFIDNIDVLIVDEISKSSVPELIRYVVNSKKIIFVGDQRQLAPLDEFNNNDYIWNNFSDEHKEIIDKYISISIFDKMFKNMQENNRAIMFTENRRSVKSLLNVYSIFYNNELEYKREDSDSIIKWKSNPLYPFTFMAMNRSRELKVGTSRKNILEAEYINTLLNDLISKIDNFSDIRVAIIATYGAQVGEIKRVVEIQKYNKKFKEVRINTVDAFQGDQADIVIISTVITDIKNNPGFINDYRRMNVAISRARDLAIVLGNESVLKSIQMRYDGTNRMFFSEIFNVITSNYIGKTLNPIQIKGVA